MKQLIVKMYHLKRYGRQSYNLTGHKRFNNVELALL